MIQWRYTKDVRNISCMATPHISDGITISGGEPSIKQSKMIAIRAGDGLERLLHRHLEELLKRTEYGA